MTLKADSNNSQVDRLHRTHQTPATTLDEHRARETELRIAHGTASSADQARYLIVSRRLTDDDTLPASSLDF
ncbi:MAG: hypothetical protein ABIA92_05065 [Patescibacteria group bacterium]